MEAKELRIGNYLHDNEGNLCQVIELGKESVYAPVIGKCITKLPNNPIPLTHEWLIKLGYTSDKPIIFETSTFYRKENHKIWCPFDQFLDAYYRFEIKYVHQLQNVYFATHQEELKLEQS